MKIGVMGSVGSFSEEAGGVYARDYAGTTPEIVYLVSAENLFTALEHGEIDRAVYPIENSNGGVVTEAVYAMARHSFDIERIFEIEVAHNLLVLPGTTPAHVTKIASHDQALKQCKMYLKRKWANTELVEHADTALAAKELHDGTLSNTTAVIASKKCSSLYNLEILEDNIQDLKFNYTSFIVAKKL